MSDEIKEKIKAYYVANDINEILYYITNLQEENERLKELCDKYEEEHSNEFKIWKDERQQLLDYKSRNEKAIEYINKNILISFDKVGFKTDKVAGIVVDNLLNILNGGDKE